MSGSRHRARQAALQTLYLWEVGQATPEQALEAYFAEHAADLPEGVRTFARELVLGTTSEVGMLDALIQQHSEHWRLERLAVVDRLILRLATWELRHASDTDPAIILNEALELARTFSSDDAVRFVNGVLDSVRKAIGR